MEFSGADSVGEEASLAGEPASGQYGRGVRDNDRGRASKRDNILKAAIDEFLEHGYAGARVARIARAARANKQLIYYYYGNKLDLLDSVLSYLIDSREQQVKSSFANLEQVVRSLAVPSGASMLWRRYWLWEALERKSDRIMQEDERRQAMEGVAKLVRSDQDVGFIDSKFDPEMLSLALFAMTELPNLIPQFAKLITGTAPDREVFHDRQLAFMSQLLASIAPRSD
ncbi:TetR/AcrR family transcriptional regulator [Rhodococcus koreensis]